MTYLLSAITVFFKDMTSVVNIGIQIGFWVTPILWNEGTLMDTTVKHVISLNPMHYIVNGYRDSFIYQRGFWEKPIETLYFWGVTFLLAIFAGMVFTGLENIYLNTLLMGFSRAETDKKLQDILGSKMGKKSKIIIGIIVLIFGIV